MDLTLKESWINCLKMWSWIPENLPDGFSELSYGAKFDIIDNLKEQWLNDNGFAYFMLEHCFFCDYRYGCSTCPGRLVDKRFRCNPSESSSVSYVNNPKGFYERIKELNPYGDE